MCSRYGMNGGVGTLVGGIVGAVTRRLSGCGIHQVDSFSLAEACPIQIVTR